MPTLDYRYLAKLEVFGYNLAKVRGYRRSFHSRGHFTLNECVKTTKLKAKVLIATPGSYIALPNQPSYSATAVWLKIPSNLQRCAAPIYNANLQRWFAV